MFDFDSAESQFDGDSGMRVIRVLDDRHGVVERDGVQYAYHVHDIDCGGDEHGDTGNAVAWLYSRQLQYPLGTLGTVAEAASLDELLDKLATDTLPTFTSDDVAAAENMTMLMLMLRGIGD